MAPEHVFINEEIPGEACRFCQNQPSGVGHDLRVARAPHHLLTAEDVADRGGGNGGARPQGIDRDTAAKFLSQTQGDEAHGVFRHRIAKMRREPAWIEIDRRREREDMWTGRFQKMRQAEFRDQESAAPVHRLHEVETPHVDIKRAGEGDGGSIVDADIDAAEAMQGCIHRSLDLVLVTDIGRKRERLAASRLDGLCRCVNRAFKLGMGRDCLRCNSDIGPITRRPECDGKADATRGTSDE